jgi:formylglycine-generating enzyme required for sulfatase activity
LRDEVVGDLVRLIEEGHLPAKERVDAAFLLGRLTEGHDPRLPMPEQSAYWCPIEAGEFWYGDDRPGREEKELSPDEYEPKRRAKLKQVHLPYDFLIARFPVTNAEYARFIDTGGYEQQEWWTEQGWQQREQKDWTAQRFWDNSRYNNPAQPVVGVSWYEAAAYCRWLTQQGHAQGWLPEEQEIRLPTSLEWERAARHTDQRPYPWGTEEPTPERANYRETEIGRPSPVGCFAAGAATCGAQDMAGNVLEWLATPSGQSEQEEPEKDFTPRDSVLFTWSAWTFGKGELLCGSRGRGYPVNRNSLQGFRVLQSLRSSV